MMGHLRGVATQLRKEEPTAIHVHCLAHCLNLCLQDAAKINKNVRDCLSLVMERSQLIRYSPKRLTTSKLALTLKDSNHCAQLGGLCALWQ